MLVSPSNQSATLIRHSGDLWLLKQLRIELDVLDFYAGQWNEAAVSLDPGQNIAYPTEQGRGEPSTVTSAVSKPGLAISQIGAPALSAIARTLHQRTVHLLSSMGKLGHVQSMMDFALWPLLEAHQGDSGRLAARIELDSYRLHRTRCPIPIFEPNRERIHPMHDGSLVR